MQGEMLRGGFGLVDENKDKIGLLTAEYFILPCMLFHCLFLSAAPSVYCQCYIMYAARDRRSSS